MAAKNEVKTVTRRQLEKWITELEKYETELGEYISKQIKKAHEMVDKQVASTEPPTPIRNPPQL